MPTASVDLSTTYLGLPVPSPVVAASSSLTDSVEGVRSCAEAGAGAVVLKSLFEEQIAAEVAQEVAASETPNWHAEAAEYISAYGAENAVGEYLRLIEAARKAVSIPVIPSIHCVSNQNWPAYARRMQNAGADAIELNIFVSPADPRLSGRQIEAIYRDVLAAVKAEVSVPVSLKVGHFFTSLSETLGDLVGRGADGLVLFNRFYAPDLDIERLQVVAGPAFSAPEEMHLTLRAVAQLSGQLRCDIAASTGIHDGAAVIKQLLAGAQVVQVASTLYRGGIDELRMINDDIAAWMQRRELKSIKGFRGRMSHDAWPGGSAYDRVQFMKRSVGQH
jgi:dihydroorotate dehydrogenase (fumarate)